MAKFIVKLDVNDIITSKLGENYIIQAGGVDVIFTPQALDELIKDYKNIKRENTKSFGVVAYNVEDFRDFIENLIHTHGIQPNKPHNSRKIVFDEAIYYRIIKSIDLCSHCFDEVIETNSAKDNPEYSKIMENIHLCINAKK